MEPRLPGRGRKVIRWKKGQETERSDLIGKVLTLEGKRGNSHKGDCRGVGTSKLMTRNRIQGSRRGKGLWKTDGREGAFENVLVVKLESPQVSVP